MSNEQVQEADAPTTATFAPPAGPPARPAVAPTGDEPPVFRLPSLPRLPSSTPRPADPPAPAPAPLWLPVPGRAAADATSSASAIGATGTAVDDLDATGPNGSSRGSSRARRHASGRGGRRRRTVRSRLTTLLVLVVAVAAIAAAGFQGYRAYQEANLVDGRLPTFASGDAPYRSHVIEIEVAPAATGEPGSGTTDDADAGPAVGNDSRSTEATRMTVHGGRSSPVFELTITWPNPDGTGQPLQRRGVVDPRGMFEQQPDGTWVLYVDAGPLQDAATLLGKLYVWDDLVPEPMRPYVEVRSVETDLTEQGELTTYELVLDLAGFAADDVDEFERWNDDIRMLGLGSASAAQVAVDPDELDPTGYPIEITVDSTGVVWAWTIDDAGVRVSAVVDEVSMVPYNPALPATWVESSST